MNSPILLPVLLALCWLSGFLIGTGLAKLVRRRRAGTAYRQLMAEVNHMDLEWAKRHRHHSPEAQ